jgi:hypothetical protein
MLAAGETLPAATVFQPPVGHFTCPAKPYPQGLEQVVSADAATYRISDEVGFIRIDVQAIPPQLLSERSKPGMLRPLLQFYLQRGTVPQAQVTVKNAALYGYRYADEQDRTLLHSAIIFPGKSGAFVNGKEVDGFRVQTQFTDEKYFYTISRMTHANPDLTPDDQLRKTLTDAQQAYTACTFPH